MNELQLGLVQQSIDILKHILEEGLENVERSEGLIKKVREDLIATKEINPKSGA